LRFTCLIGLTEKHSGKSEDLQNEKSKPERKLAREQENRERVRDGGAPNPFKHIPVRGLIGACAYRGYRPLTKEDPRNIDL